MAHQGVLWMGSVEPYMNEKFIGDVFKKMGESILKVELKRNRVTGEPKKYCFVRFPDDFSALCAMHRLDSRKIPGTEPPVMFFLNHTSLGGKNAMEKDFSLFVGSLSPDVDNITLFKGFAFHYLSVRRAKVIRDENGDSRGFGYVRFAEEKEQKNALFQMDGYEGIGKTPLRVKIAANKVQKKTDNPPQSVAVVQATWNGEAQSSTSATKTQQYYYQDYGQYQNYVGASAPWTNYGNYCYPPDRAYGYSQLPGTPQQPPILPPAYPVPQIRTSMGSQMAHSAEHVDLKQDDDHQLVEHSLPIDVARLNAEIINRSDDLWESLDDARWLPTGTFDITSRHSTFKFH